MSKIEPDSVFATLNGGVRARFTFEEGGNGALKSAGLYDALGRPWIDLDFVSRQYSVNEYDPNTVSAGADPTTTFIDSDSDGLVDRMKDWVRGGLYCAQQKIEWGECSPKREPVGE